MIDSKPKYIEAVAIEKQLYFPDRKDYLYSLLVHDQNYIIFKYLKSLRYLEYCINTNKCKIIRMLAERKKNALGFRYGIYICPNSVEIGLRIWHSGSVIIHSAAKIGKNCQLHGMNCIGNKGVPSEAPRIGDNCNIGIGAVLIGNITLSNNITIGANAVVTTSCYTDGAVLVGIPAKNMS